MNAHSWLYSCSNPIPKVFLCALLFSEIFFPTAVEVGHNFLVLLPGQSMEADCQLRLELVVSWSISETSTL